MKAYSGSDSESVAGPEMDREQCGRSMLSRHVSIYPANNGTGYRVHDILLIRIIFF